SDTKGADLMWVPVGFEKSFQMAYSRTRYGTGYYIYHQFAPGTKLSQPIKAWDGKRPPDKDVLELITKGGAAGHGGGSATATTDVPAAGASQFLNVDAPNALIRS